MAEWAIAIAILMIAIGQLVHLEAGSKRVEMAMMVMWLVCLIGFLALVGGAIGGWLS